MAHLTTLLICDHAQVRENLLMVLSGGITRLQVAEVPTSIHFTVALVVEIPYVELEDPHEVRMTIIDPETAGPVGEPFIASLRPIRQRCSASSGGSRSWFHSRSRSLSEWSTPGSSMSA